MKDIRQSLRDLEDEDTTDGQFEAILNLMQVLCAEHGHEEENGVCVWCLRA